SGCRVIIVIILKEAIESWVGGFQRVIAPLRTWGSEESRLYLSAGTRNRLNCLSYCQSGHGRRARVTCWLAECWNNLCKPRPFPTRFLRIMVRCPIEP